MHLPDAIDRIRPCIVQIAVKAGEITVPGAAITVAGTGFFVHADGFVLTARHVVTDARSLIEEGGHLLAGMALPEVRGPVTIIASFAFNTATVIEEDPRHDIALLQVEPNPFASGTPSGISNEGGSTSISGMYGVAPIMEPAVRDGDAVATSGYPSVAPALVTTHGVVASATATDVVEVQPPGAPEGITIPDVKDAYLIDVAVNPGNSGGPVYSIGQGAVIGVCVAFHVSKAASEAGSPFSFNSGLAVAVPIKYGIELLQRHAAPGRETRSA